MVVISKKKTGIDEYRSDDDITPMFIKGNSLDVLKAMPDKSIDMCITSPPYWGQRQYDGGGIGLEKNHKDVYLIILLNGERLRFLTLRKVISSLQW